MQLMVKADLELIGTKDGVSEYALLLAGCYCGKVLHGTGEVCFYPLDSDGFARDPERYASITALFDGLTHRRA